MTQEQKEQLKKPENEFENLSRDEAFEEVFHLIEEHRKLINLPIDEFISDETGEKLKWIHERELKLVHAIGEL